MKMCLGFAFSQYIFPGVRQHRDNKLQKYLFFQMISRNECSRMVLLICNFTFQVLYQSETEKPETDCHPRTHHTTYDGVEQAVLSERLH